MIFGICNVSVAPVRAESSDRAEMVTQLLFGEKLEILEKSKKWWRIKVDFDGYEGFVDPKQITEISENSFFSKNLAYTTELFNLALTPNGPLTLPLGASIWGNIPELSFEYLGEKAEAHPDIDIVEIGKTYLNVPYLWGGKSNFGIDCSGLIQEIFKFKNIKLPRNASQQAEFGEVLCFIEEAQPGNLAFFDNEEGQIIHVGLITEPGKILHAHGKVRIDPIDSNGIFNTDSKSYSHRLRYVKSLNLMVKK
ncbi:Gamma-D-glutamyl-L-lysine endopeptidase [Candidatus Ornithobacterium hominis]|uniref:C40 family peptidase n=1 Tax=Candidatus Ornithobacterium hominis TaxID=2497989 RepID=UPI0024BCEF7B|nr:C40 family peptidase [Candidatus Ornithobacterium hominis]CAI9429432.1 Gamma-D-glutamyl-L-lysine endopeptidase [Candidatus Ornithobacterium hominis]